MINNILNKLEGPTTEEALSYMNNLSPKDMFEKSYNICFREGMEQGIINKYNIHMFDDIYLRDAALTGKTEAVEVLLKYGADINALYGSPLANAVSKSHYDVVKLLFENGVDIENHGAKLAYKNAMKNGNTYYIKLLNEYKSKSKSKLGIILNKITKWVY